MSTLIVLAKAPVPGRVKTRLCPPFTPEQAAGLAEAALRDTLRAAMRTTADHLLVYLDGEPGPWLPREQRETAAQVERQPQRQSRRPRRALPRQQGRRQPGGPLVRVARQPEGGLDVRIAAAFAEAARHAPGPAVLIGMDTPQVTPQLLDTALAQLAGGAQAVFGPAADGGFWALGLDQAHATQQTAEQLVHGVPMSVDDTGRVQLERLHAAGLHVALLPELRDVDAAADAHAAAALVPDSAFAARLADYTPPIGGPASSWAGPVLSRYEQALWESTTRPPAPLHLELEGGGTITLDIARYCDRPDAADELLLDRCTGPTLDIGCGPGRLAAELAHRGVPSLGVDVAPVAVLLARCAGATALRRSVFDRLPGEGRWAHALLIDGNIGIGGDPGALLDRIGALLTPSGELVVETAPGPIDERPRLRSGHGGASMPWARLGPDALTALAEKRGYTAVDEWQVHGRHFVALTTPAR
ncbi:MAG TPA: DUF2064 domain-containing protein [Actinocrinis sp.]|nr:DUF2064 domain-containing protein [Actinocrinis sp.]